MNCKPERTCTVCRKKTSKDELIRIVKNKEGVVLIDYTKKADGRGAYICNNIECIQLARKKSAFERSFKTRISQDIYVQLEKISDNN